MLTPPPQPPPLPLASSSNRKSRSALFTDGQAEGPISGAGAAAMSAMEAFSGPGTGGQRGVSDEEEEPVIMSIDTGGSNPTPVLSVESARSAGSNTSAAKAVSRTTNAAAAPQGGARQLNVPVSMQHAAGAVPQQDEAHSSSFLTAVDTGLPSITRSSVDSSVSLQQQQQQQQQPASIRTSADFGGRVRKPSPKHSQQQNPHPA